MDEYIKKENVLRAYEEVQRRNGPWRFETLIESIPSADVAPVRHGQWMTTSGEVFPGSSQFLCYSHKHEECGFQYVDLSENEYDYCPNCGCRMDLEG